MFSLVMCEMTRGTDGIVRRITRNSEDRNGDGETIGPESIGGEQIPNYACVCVHVCVHSSAPPTNCLSNVS